VRLEAVSAEETRAIGARLAEAIASADEPGPLVIGLSGELGAGKTTLVGGLLEALGHAGPVRSPTYTLIEPYGLADRDVHHCDLFRLRDPSELADLGLRDLLAEHSLLLVEWPERGGDRLPPTDLSLHLGYLETGRFVDVSADSPAGARVVAHLRLDHA
jgi:tRNA threonylcarbamoyladenosine biosynthesis protein TsaE